MWEYWEDAGLVRHAPIVAVLRADTAAARRLIASVKQSRFLLDLTGGRRRQSLLVLSTGHVVLTDRPVQAWAFRLRV